MNNNIEDFEFGGYGFTGGYDDGYTIFMFSHLKDENQGFTLSLRDHEGFDDHNHVYFEDERPIPEKYKAGILKMLETSMNEQKDNAEVFSVIKRCVDGINS